MADKLTANTTFETAGVQLVKSSGRVGMPWDSGTRVYYIASSDMVRLVLSDGRQIDFETPDSSSGFPFAAGNDLKMADATGDTERTLYIGAPVVEGVNLTYTRWGSFSEKYLSASQPDGLVQSSYFVFGIPTRNMPTSGTATYSASISATGQSNRTIYIYTNHSAATFQADFGSGSITTAIHLMGAPFNGGGPVKDFGTIDGTGTIGGHAFDGTWISVPGEFHGSFFGPAAEEMGYSFFFNTGMADASGHVAGRKD